VSELPQKICALSVLQPDKQTSHYLVNHCLEHPRALGTVGKLLHHQPELMEHCPNKFKLNIENIEIRPLLVLLDYTLRPLTDHILGTLYSVFTCSRGSFWNYI